MSVSNSLDDRQEEFFFSYVLLLLNKRNATENLQTFRRSVGT